MAAPVNDTDPLTLPQHPLPVRTVISQIPRSLLSNILTSCAGAYQAQDIKILHLDSSGIELAYMQPPPQRELYFKPVARQAKIRFGDGLPPLPALPKGKDASSAEFDEGYLADCLKWETAISDHLKEMDRAARNMMEGRTDIAVTRFIGPQDFSSVASLTTFIILTLSLLIQLIFKGDAPAPFTQAARFLSSAIFNEEWKLNAAVFVHAGMILKRASDMFKMAEKCRRFRVDLHSRRLWYTWLAAGGLEGWRAVRRLELEADRVGRALAAGDKKKD